MKLLKLSLIFMLVMAVVVPVFGQKRIEIGTTMESINGFAFLLRTITPIYLVMRIGPFLHNYLNPGIGFRLDNAKAAFFAEISLVKMYSNHLDFFRAETTAIKKGLGIKLCDLTLSWFKYNIGLNEFSISYTTSL